MKKIFIPLLTVVVLVSIIFAGCVPGAPPAPPVTPPPVTPPPVTPPPVTPTPEEEGWGPMKGVGIRPDGTPYVFALNCLFRYNNWTRVETGIAMSLAKRTGAVMTLHDPNLDVSKQVEIMEDLIVKHPDAIIVHPVDTIAMVPLFDKAGRAGIPCFNYNFVVEGSWNNRGAVDHDQINMGQACAKWLIDEAERTGEKIIVYELWGAMGTEGAMRRHVGFNDEVAGNPMIEVIESPGTDWVHEKAFTAIIDGLTAHPEINAIYSQGNLVEVSVEALKTLGRLYSSDDPRHIYFLTIDEDPDAMEALRAGYVDLIAAHSGWECADGGLKLMFLYVCIGKPGPSRVTYPSYGITVENAEQGRWGAPRHYGDLFMEELNFDNWPVLEIPAEYGIPTPTKDMKLPGY